MMLKHLTPRGMRAAIFILSLGVWLATGAGCQSAAQKRARGSTSTSDDKKASKPEKPPEARPALADAHDKEIRAILDLARLGKWDAAIAASTELKAKFPDHPAVQRVDLWVRTEAQRRTDRALEGELRTIEAQDSRFYETPESLLLDKRSRGLDLPRSLRQALDEVPKGSDIPDSFGQTIAAQGPMVGLGDQKPTGMDALLDKRITVQLDDVTLESIVFTIGKNAGLNFVADRSLPQFQKKLSVNLKDAPLREFLDYVSRQMDLKFEVGENIIWILDAKDQKGLTEETRFYRLRRGFVMPARYGPSEVTVTTTKDKEKEVKSETSKVEQFVRDGAPEKPTIEDAIGKFFTGSKYMIDYERNLIVARGTREQLKGLEEIIREFDKPIQQVLIEARFITVTEAAFQQLGVNWETGRDPLANTRSPVDQTGIGTNVGLGLEYSFTGVFSSEQLSATLSALEQSGESQTLSAPRLTVLNNRPAHIRDGKSQYYYEEYTVSQTITDRQSASQLVPKGKPTSITSGVSLDVLASIGGDGHSILLALHPVVTQDVQLVTFATVSDRDENGQLVRSFDIKLPQSRDQELSTRVVVKSGETVAMGGVIENVQSTFTESVPILGNLPLIGAAFRKKTEISKPRYLLIFVTATLLSDTGEFIRYEDTPTSP